jgi:hypothetical protein
MKSGHIIRELWNASEMKGWLAVWDDGSTAVITTGYAGELDAEDPLVILRPEGFLRPGMSLGEALDDRHLRREIETLIGNAGGTITPDNNR